MALNSINTNIAAYYAQQNINKASQNASLSVARLSSGNRIVNASDDVAALSAGTTLKSQVTTLRTALQNASQGGSLLQVADGALSQVQDILQRQKAIAVQASSGSVDDAQRSFLDQEFQALSLEIDRLATSTNFNGVKLLDGSVFQANALVTATGTSAQGAIRLSLSSSNFAASDTISFQLGGNAVSFSFTATVATSVQATLGGSASASIDSLISKIQAYTGANASILSGYTFSRIGSSLQIDANSGGDLASEGGGLIINTSAVNGGVLTNDGAVLTAGSVYALNNADDAGLGQGSTGVTGTVGDSLLRNLDSSKASVAINFSGTNSGFIANTSVITVAGVVFDFTATASTTDATQIVIGATMDETIDNIVQTMASFVGHTSDSTNVTAAASYAMNQLSFRRDGNSVVVDGKQAGTVYTSANAIATVLITPGTIAGGSPTAATNLAGTTTGVNVNGVNNSAFVGKISGFAASYVSSDTVNLTVKVGSVSYTSSAVDTTPTANTNILFTSADGGSFRVDLAANQGTAVATQSDADDFAARFNAAFSSLTFYQTRDVSSFSAVGNIITADGTNIGALNGTSVVAHLSNFSSVKLNDIKVTAPVSGGTTGSIQMTLGTEVFTSGPINTSIGANAVVRLTSTTNNNNYIDFHGPSTTSNDPAAVTAIDISTSTNAKTVQEALKDAFGLNDGGQALTFQVGNNTSDVLEVTIGTATTSALYLGVAANVTSQANAAIASAAVDAAISRVTSVRAGVGALQERFNFATAAISSSIQNQDAARGVLLDTDVATESTAFATAQVQLQAGIAVLAQSNLLPQNLLKLIG